MALDRRGKGRLHGTFSRWSSEQQPYHFSCDLGPILWSKFSTKHHSLWQQNLSAQISYVHFFLLLHKTPSQTLRGPPGIPCERSSRPDTCSQLLDLIFLEPATAKWGTPPALAPSPPPPGPPPFLSGCPFHPCLYPEGTYPTSAPRHILAHSSAPALLALWLWEAGPLHGYLSGCGHCPGNAGAWTSFTPLPPRTLTVPTALGSKLWQDFYRP